MNSEFNESQDQRDENQESVDLDEMSASRHHEPSLYERLQGNAGQSRNLDQALDQLKNMVMSPKAKLFARVSLEKQQRLKIHTWMTNTNRHQNRRAFQLSMVKKLSLAYRMIPKAYSYFHKKISSDMASYGLLNGALYDFSDRENVEPRNQRLNQISYFFDAVFIIECILKIIAKGFVCHSASYLRDGWNIIDFAVVISAILELLPLGTGSSFKGIRALRALRPLKSVNAIPSMKKLVKVLMISLPNLANVIFLLTFIVFLFALIGLHTFRGKLYYRCRSTEVPVSEDYWPILEEYEQLCYYKENENSCPVGSYCGHPQDYNIDLKYDNVSSTSFISYGIVQFDNIGYAVLTVFQVLTLQGWSRIMYNYMDSTSTIFSAFYFCILVIFGSYFLLNLILAVIIEAFMKIEQKELKKEQEKQQEEANQRQRKYEAVKTMHRMMRLFQNKKELVEKSGGKYRWSFFDVVFELVRVKRYEAVQKNIKQSVSTQILTSQMIKQNTQILQLKQNFSSQMNDDCSQNQSDLTLRKHASSATIDQEESKEEINESMDQKGLLPLQRSRSRRRLSVVNPALKALSANIALSERKLVDIEEEDINELNSQNDEPLNRYNSPKTTYQVKISGVQENQVDEQNQIVLEIKVKQIFTNHLKRWCHNIIHARGFNITMNIFILLNCLIMAIDRYPTTVRQTQLEQYSIYVFFVLFTIEMILKLIGLGLHQYFSDFINIYDTFIILVNILDIILTSVLTNSAAINSLYVLRGLRILRLLKIFKSWERLQELLATMIITLKDLRNFLVLLFICMFAFTLLGLQLFAFKMKFNQEGVYDLEEGTSPRINFDGFLNAFTAVFNIFQGEQWHLIMYNAARSVGWWSVLYFVIIVLFGQIILLRLFLAVLLEKFEDKRKEIEERKAQEGNEEITMVSQLKSFVKNKLVKLTTHDPEKNKVLAHLTYDRTLYLFSEHNKFRLFCARLIIYPAFEYTILAFIILSSLFLAIENPLDSSTSTKNKVLAYLNMCMTLVFTFEILAKIIAKGLILHGKNSYLRSYWNALDFIIVILSIVSECFPHSKLKIFKILRMIKILRPLRVIGRNEGLKLAVHTLIHVIPNVFNVSIISLIFYMIFGVFCVTFTKGELYYCHTEQLESGIGDIEIDTLYDCLNIGGEWINRQANFDNILNAMQTLYATSLVNWPQWMLTLVDARGIGYAPGKNHNQYWQFFFILFIIIFSFFLLNFFVGVVVGTFVEQKQQLGKNFLLTNSQKEWLNMKLKLLNTKPVFRKKVKSKNIIRRCSFHIINHKSFEVFIFTIIILNTLTQTIHWYLIPISVSEPIKIINYVFAGIFAIEAIIKIIALGRSYFKESWNIFDFIIVIATLVGIMIDCSFDLGVGTKTTIIRAFRVVRIFRIIKKAKVLRIIIDTFIVSLPSLLNVGGLLFLIIFIYAVLGVQLFADIKLQEDLNHHANFQYFSTAFLTLIRVSTGEEWDLLMADLSMERSIVNQCDNNTYQATGIINGCGNKYSIAYLISFSLIVQIVFWNLFVAIVLQNFEDMNSKQHKLLNEETMEMLRECWADFDEDGTGFINTNEFEDFLTKLGPPLGFSRQEVGDQMKKNDFMKRLILPTYKQMKHYYYYDVIQSLAQAAYMKIEAEKKLKLSFYKKSGGTVSDILKALEKELVFEEGDMHASEALVFKKALSKETKIYKKFELIKDDLDSQHLWAGRKIINMYGKTQMIFKGGSLKREKQITRVKTIKEEPINQPHNEPMSQPIHQTIPKLNIIHEENENEISQEANPFHQLAILDELKVLRLSDKDIQPSTSSELPMENQIKQQATFVKQPLDKIHSNIKKGRNELSSQQLFSSATFSVHIQSSYQRNKLFLSKKNLNDLLTPYIKEESGSNLLEENDSCKDRVFNDSRVKRERSNSAQPECLHDLCKDFQC